MQNWYIEGRPNIAQRPDDILKGAEAAANVLPEGGVDGSNIALHSLRSGGASAAANAGVSDRLFKRHGGWKTDTAKDGYVKYSLADLLLVSRALKL